MSFYAWRLLSSCAFAAEFNTTACTMKWFFCPHSAQRSHYAGAKTWNPALRVSASAFTSLDNQTEYVEIMKYYCLPFVSMSRWSEGRLLHRNRHPAAGWFQAGHKWHHAPRATTKERWAPIRKRQSLCWYSNRSPSFTGSTEGGGFIATWWIVLNPVCLFLFARMRILELLPHEDVERLNDVKFLVQQLYTTLRIEEHQLSKERALIGRLEELNSQIRPLEKVSTPLQYRHVL